MKYTFLVFALCLVGGLRPAHAQVPVYISKQTGEFTTFSGSGAKTTDKYENGVCNLSSTGPILYSASPNFYSIGTNETKIWDGKVWGDVANGPAPGTSANATLKGDYTVSYSRPDPNAPGGHEMINGKKGTVNISFTVYSVNVEAVDSVPLCPGKEISIPATGYPAGGTYTWTAGAGLRITAGQGTETISVKDVSGKPATLSVKYTVGGVSYSKNIRINVIKGPLKVTAPDTVSITPGQQTSITPVGSPKGGTYTWEVSGPVTLSSGPYNYVAFIKAGQQPGIGKATVTYRYCNMTATKTVIVRVRDCTLEAPDSIHVIKDKTASVTAIGSPANGTYAWTGGNATYQVTGGGNAATVTIKGLQKGVSSLSVNFKANQCNESKTVGVRVLDKLILDVSPGKPAILCKGNLQAFTATGFPGGGTYTWASTGPVRFTSALNTRWAWVEATGGGNASVTCTYSLNGESISKTVDFKCREIKSVTITPNPANDPLADNISVTYTASAIDQDGNDVSNEVSFDWEEVYRPFGAANNPATWQTIKLQGNGKTATVTWHFSFTGNTPPPAGSQMEGWVQAVVWCPVRIGSKWVKVNK